MGGKGRGRGRARVSRRDEILADDSVALTNKMGKWSRKAEALVLSFGFRICLLVSFRVAESWDTILWVLQRPEKPGKINTMARFVFSKCEQIWQLVLKLNRRDAWDDIVGMVSPEMRSGLRHRISQLVHFTIGEFVRRFVDRINQWDCQLLILAIVPPDHCSVRRANICKALLETPLEDLHISARKTRLLFHNDIHRCVLDEGRIPTRLYAPWRIAALNWSATTQEIESVMNMINSRLKSSPSISHAVLDAQVGTTKQLFSLRSDTTTTAASYKWSAIQPVVEELVDVALPYVGECHAVMVPDRWKPALEVSRSISNRSVFVDPALRPSFAAKWAAQCTLMLRRAAARNASIFDVSSVMCIEVE